MDEIAGKIVILKFIYFNHIHIIHSIIHIMIYFFTTINRYHLTPPPTTALPPSSLLRSGATEWENAIYMRANKAFYLKIAAVVVALSREGVGWYPIVVGTLC